MAGGLIFEHGLCSVGISFFLLRPLQLGFGLGALLRMAGHDCTYSASNRDSARHIRLTQAGRQVRFRFYLLIEPFLPVLPSSWLKSDFSNSLLLQTPIITFPPT